MNKEKHIYEVIVEELKRISKKEVLFGFIEDYKFGNSLFLEGRFILMGSNLSAETISINHKKRLDRDIKINYIKSNNIKDNSINELIEIEDILLQLSQSQEILKRILNIDYAFDISLLKENDDDLTGVLNIEIILKIKEK